MADRDTAKALGAFYTDAQVADFLVWWAVRSAQDSVIDPSFGGGVFLRSACLRLTELNGDPANQVYGIELEPVVFSRISEKLTGEFGVSPRNLLNRDFFSIDPAAVDKVDAVVGNPPFIRYQRFSGAVRKMALGRAADAGVKLTELSSSWAPFLVHSVSMLKPGGRLAMVAPFEIAQADYAVPVLDHLSKSFGRVTFLTFRRKLFPELSESTLLLLAEDKQPGTAQFLWRDLAHAGTLREIQSQAQIPIPAARAIETRALAEGRRRLGEYFIPRRARELYRELRSLRAVRPLGELADVGIGYVTGANDFFHPSGKQIQYWKIPDHLLRPALRRGRSLRGLRLSRDDWEAALRTGDSGYLLYIDQQTTLPDSVRRYLRWGEAEGIAKAYKCRTRTPWYSVPHVYEPDALLSYMSGGRPRLVANDAGVVAPNTLHVVRFHPGFRRKPDELAAVWMSSLTRLSAELEGHSLGGGMLKLEPTEAEAVLVADPLEFNGGLAPLARELDGLMRDGKDEIAEQAADEAILNRVGLNDRDCALLRSAAQALRNRRYSKA